jgi:hypothetical protein
MEFTKRFVITLKSAIKVQVSRVDGSPLLIETTNLLADWPCRLKPSAESPDDIEPREGPQIDLTVIRFSEKNRPQSWYDHWKTKDGLTDPMLIQIKRDNILSRQEVN